MKKYILNNYLLSSKFIYFFLITLFAVAAVILILLSESIPDNNIKEQTFSFLNKIKESKKSEVINFFSQLKDVDLNVKYDKKILSAFNKMKQDNNNPILELEIDKHYVKKYGQFYDILFVNSNGYVFHSIKKEDDYKINIFTQGVIPSKFSSSTSKIKKIQLLDFEYYLPSDEESAFFTIPINNEKQQIGWIILQFSVNKINKILSQREGMGRTGEVYLVNQQYLMLTNSRFIEGSTILKKKINTLAVKDAFSNIIGENIIQDYRGVNVFSSYEMFELMGIKWVIVVEIDEDEIITEYYKKYKNYFQKEIIQYLAKQPIIKKSKVRYLQSLKRVDINEFFKSEKNVRLITFGVSTCTSIAISYPDKFSYLAHITPTDEIYIDDPMTKWLVGDHYQNILTQLLDQIIHYDIYPYELKQLEVVIAAPHDNSFNKTIDILLEHKIELSKIKIIYLPKANSINVALKNTGKILDITMTNRNNLVDINTSVIEDLGTILKKIIHYDINKTIIKNKSA